MLRTPRRTTALLATGVLALGGLTVGCGDDVVDDTLEEDINDGVDDVGDTFEDGVAEIDDEIDEMDDDG